jgi:phage tail protein X
MKRYYPINQITTDSDLKRRYKTTRYPEILFGESDTYVYTTKGDRIDVLAQTYYFDSSLWWIISLANPNIISFDSIYLPVGEQIRIPSISQISLIMARYEALNNSN